MNLSKILMRFVRQIYFFASVEAKVAGLWTQAIQRGVLIQVLFGNVFQLTAIVSALKARLTFRENQKEEKDESI